MKRFLSGLVLLQAVCIGGSAWWQNAALQAQATYVDTGRFLVGLLILPLLMAAVITLMWAGVRPGSVGQGLIMTGAALVCTVGVGIWLMATWAFMNTGYGYTPLLFWLDAAAVVAAAVQTVQVKKSAG